MRVLGLQTQPKVVECAFTDCEHTAISCENRSEVREDTEVDDNIMITMQWQGLFDRNDISNSRLAGVWIRQGADPAFVRNTIRDGRDVGVFIYNEGNVRSVSHFT
jgi:hypothetical protein